MEKIIEQGQQVMLNTYKQLDVVMDYGVGNYIYDTKGNKYLDFVAGIATNVLGYSHDGLKKAIQHQAERLLHCSNLYWNKNAVEVATRLVEKSGLSRVFFCNSGAESMEAAMKLVRKAHYINGNPEKVEFITMKQSFHGRTIGAISATGQTKYQEGFGPLVKNIFYATYNDLESVAKLINPKTCAIIIEPIQGEGGIKPADPEFIKGIRALCDAHNVYLIFDEVQCGIGRTGTLFAYQQYHVKPDVVCLAKALGGGVPIGAIVADEMVSVGFAPGDHASTFGGNPLSTAAAKAVLEAVDNQEFLSQVTEKGQYLTQKLSVLVDRYFGVNGVRGMGLMQGLVLEKAIDRNVIVKIAMEKGLLLVPAGDDVIRFVPPLTIHHHEIDMCVRIIDEILAERLPLKPDRGQA